MTQPVALPTVAAQQQAAAEVFAQYEPVLYEAYLEMMLEWLAAVQAAIFTGGVKTLGLVPDPIKVFSQTPKWHTLTAEYSERVAEEVLAAPYRNLGMDDTLFDSRPFVRNWIADRENRLNRVPDEVYGMVAQIIDSATTNGASIPDVTEQVQTLFDSADITTWKNRARTVARTEVVGAYNGGLYDAFSALVAADPETKWVKRWLATEDQRTRPDHREADGQVVPWGETFDVGGFAMLYPHDPTAPAKEVVNCRCTMLLEIENEPTEMSNRQYKDGLTAAGLPTSMSLMQYVCLDGAFCMQTHKPGLCKGQKRGQKEPGTDDAAQRNPAQRAQVAVTGLTEAIAKAQAIATAQAATNPRMAAMARKAVAAYQKALRPHAQTLKDAARENDRTKTQADRDTREQDAIDKREAKKKETLGKRAQKIIDRRKRQAEETKKLAKMTPAQRTAYRKAKAEKARKQREAEENKLIKQANAG